jgi:peptidoglycan-associated lipoprotein
MVRQASKFAWPRAAAIVGVALLAGCGYAKRSDVDAQLAQLRQDMATADAATNAKADANARRIAEVEQALQQLRTDFNVRIDRLQGEYEGLIAFDVPVHFDYDQAMIREQDRQVLERFASVTKKYYPGSLITVEGFTDPAGSTAYNQRLGMERAESVKDYLVSQGMGETLLRTVSYGESKDRLIAPTATKDQPEAIANRRVTFVIDTRGSGMIISSR